MDKIQRSNDVRERFRESFSPSANFIFEHLANGHCKVSIEDGNKKAQLLFNSADSVSSIINNLNNKLNAPYDFMSDILEKCGLYVATNADIVEPEYKPIDGKIALANFEAFTSLFSDEEVAVSNNLIKMTRANRVWLLENKKVVLNTAQNKKFHELANKARLALPTDIDAAILEAFELASKE
jgi:hypothetical protein